MKSIRILSGIMFTMLVAMLFASVTNMPFVGIGIAMLSLAAVPKPTGALMFNFADLTWADGTENMGGVKVIGYYALASEIATWAELPSAPSDAASEVTLEGDFRMADGKYWHKIYSTEENNEIVDENQGEVDGQSFVHKATIMYPGTSAEVLAFAKNANNSGMVFIFEEVSGGNRRVIGSEAFPAKVKPSFTSGKATADRKGMTMEIQSYGYTPAPLYDGVIELESSTVS